MSGKRSRDPLDGETIAVIGAGFGGLSAACYLADAGAEVTLFERDDHPSGCAGRIERDGFRIDTRPSWYLMPAVFDRFFEQFGRSAGEFYDPTELDPGYEVCWKDGDRAAMPADRTGQKGLVRRRRGWGWRQPRRLPRRCGGDLRIRDGAVRLPQSFTSRRWCHTPCTRTRSRPRR